jgi:hypothetical protein
MAIKQGHKQSGGSGGLPNAEIRQHAPFGKTIRTKWFHKKLYPSDFVTQSFIPSGYVCCPPLYADARGSAIPQIDWKEEGERERKREREKERERIRKRR